MQWVNLFIAGLFEILWAITLKYSNGFINFGASIITIIGMIASFYFLALATKTLPISISYAIWSGMGVLGTTILSFVLLGEEISFIKIFFLLLIFAGIVGLKLVST